MITASRVIILAFGVFISVFAFGANAPSQTASAAQMGSVGSTIRIDALQRLGIIKIKSSKVCLAEKKKCLAKCARDIPRGSYAGPGDAAQCHDNCNNLFILCVNS